MADDALRMTIAARLTEYRKKSGLTQAELAEKINYSDKSISKWERGDGVPDIFVLIALAELYGVTVNELVYDEVPQDKCFGGENTAEDKPNAVPLTIKSKLLIGVLSIGLAWLAAGVIFFALNIAVPSITKAWLVFIAAIPVSAIIAVVFTAMWSKLRYQFIAVSVLIWSLALMIHLSFIPFSNGVIWIYLVALMLQILAILWFLLRKQNKRARNSLEETVAETDSVE